MEENSIYSRYMWERIARGRLCHVGAGEEGVREKGEKRTKYHSQKDQRY